MAGLLSRLFGGKAPAPAAPVISPYDLAIMERCNLTPAEWSAMTDTMRRDYRSRALAFNTQPSKGN